MTTFLAALIAASACASARREPADARPVWEQYSSATCPIPEGKLGYPIVARASGVDRATLEQIARAVGNYWPRTPKPLEDTTSKPEDRHSLALHPLATPHVALHRHNWTPRIGDTATVALLYLRGQRPRALPASGSSFHHRATRAVRAAIERGVGRMVRDSLPLLLPDAAPDSTVVQLSFGVEPIAGEAVARFAVMETETSPRKGTKMPSYPEAARAEGRQGDVRVAFVLTDSRRVDMRTALILSADDQEMAKSVGVFMAAARFNPHVLDCETVTEVLIQPFRFRLTGLPYP